jgi:hypothetical protein
MRIGIVGSMHYVEKMLEARDFLNQMGHSAFLSSLTATLVGKSDEEKERIKTHQKNNNDAIRDFWRLMQGSDAILVMNFDRHGIKNYVGGGMFLEIGFAHVLNQKIFMLNPIPDIKFYQSEIEAMKPIIINGDYSLIK